MGAGRDGGVELGYELRGRALGRMIKGLKAAGIYDSTLFIVSASTGIAITR